MKKKNCCFSYSKEALEVNAKLLEINPEYYTAWNYRKLAVEHRLTQSESDPDSDSDSVNAILNVELKVVILALFCSQNWRNWILIVLVEFIVDFLNCCISINFLSDQTKLISNR